MLEELREAKVLANVTSADVGPEAKEYNLLRADEEYRNGNVDHSIYYQVKAQFHSTDMRYITEAEELEKLRPTTEELIRSASNQEKVDYKSNKLWQSILKRLQEVEQQKPPEQPTKDALEYMDFLEDVRNATEGLTRISDICNAMPNEWCILHLCKGFNPATTYSVFNEIMASNGAIYLSLLRHCRSPQLGPICLRFAGDKLANLFREYSTMVQRFKRVVFVDPLNVKSREVKQKYWEELKVFESYLQKLHANLRDIFLPYSFLFFGKRYDCSDAQRQAKIIYSRVDDFCLLNQWSSHQRVLLSQAALHANRLDSANLKLISYELSSNENEIQSVYDMLKDFASDWNQVEERQPLVGRRFPTILVVDERLDHFNWEQLVTVQEFTRIKSLHCLWRLFQIHKSKIKHGYFTTNIKQGMCVINPDADLVNSSRRLRSFFEYWLPQWKHMFDTVPNEEVILKQAFQADCFVYAGHGSGLQYVNGRTISRAQVCGVVFLFGCDSTRMLGTGLYSALYGAHDYYHGALCPSIVGTLMPALDGNIDTVSATALSLWLAPGTKQVIPWTQIDRVPWLKSGIIKGKEKSATTMSVEPNYHLGSLCSIISLVHQGKVEPQVYNYSIYVCRGLPAWNLAVEKMPL
ncbi:uncharacterized protein LOC128258665 [Drosophila gunungcola]|uniref:separase n=1 Tax=Drosophila gunungcola TaxID=103775 RepID=A0A9P9YPG3_9MUSC|nr:uncharacterized protein LOC128258665 [Drosophila gunungcola]KAI8040765.1 hypothetical protein M5D96_006708 [Drosophila gunungcola]